MIVSPAKILPPMLSLTCRVDGVALPDIFVLVTLKMQAKNDIHLLVGPSNQMGGILVTETEMRKQAESEANTFPMDYMPFAAFSGEIVITPMNVARINAAIEAYTLYHSSITYPRNYLNHLRTAIERLEPLAPGKLSVNAAQGASGPIKIISEIAAI